MSRLLPMLDDLMVRAMARDNHVPAEVWTVDGHHVETHCRACGNPWPCETRNEVARLAEADAEAWKQAFRRRRA